MRATRALLLAIAVALAGVLVLVSVALESGADAGLEFRAQYYEQVAVA